MEHDNTPSQFDAIRKISLDTTGGVDVMSRHHMSQVEKSGKKGWYRPDWSYGDNREKWDTNSQMLEMIHSLRNTCEQIRDEIKGIRSCSTVMQGFKDLSKIRKNTAKPRKKTE